MELVKQQYEKFPYPHQNLIGFLAKPHPYANLHASYEAGLSLTNKIILPHENKKIALIGCGTQEPMVFAYTHKKANIYACDISKKAVMYSKIKTLFRGLNNISYFNQNLFDFLKNKSDFFDYIHCYGVLHHLENYESGFTALSQALKNENGFARIMVYSASSRQRISDLRRLFQLLKIDFNTKDFKNKVHQFIQILPDDHPLKITFFKHPEINTRSGLVDAFLHAQETSFDIKPLVTMLEKNNLYIHAWDFSSNMDELISSARGNTLIEKINYLESTEQWPTNFVFWVAKSKPTPYGTSSHYTLNPQFKNNLKMHFYSALKKRWFKFNFKHQKLLKMAKNKKYLSRFELNAFPSELKDFEDTRIFLGVIL